MHFLSPKQIARRAVLAPDALYRSAPTHGVARSQTTRALHLMLLLAVLYQLISSEFIERPLPGEAPSTLFWLHEYIGMGSLGLVCAFWLWTLVRQGETRLVKLLPWLSPRAIAAIVADVVDQTRAILRRDFSGDGSGALASAVHGLGLLVVTVMAGTGTVLFFSSGAVAHDAMALHQLVANLMWAYLIGHAGLAALHHLLGSDILRRMFWIGRGVTITTRPPVKAKLSSEKTRV